MIDVVIYTDPEDMYASDELLQQGKTRTGRVRARVLRAGRLHQRRRSDRWYRGGRIPGAERLGVDAAVIEKERDRLLVRLDELLDQNLITEFEYDLLCYAVNRAAQ